MATSSFAERIVTLAEENPNKPAFIFLDKTFARNVISRMDLKVLSQRCASVFVRYDVKPGDVVCNTLPNSPLRLVTQLACHMAGAVDMNGQICLADGSDFITNLKRGDAKLVILDPQDRNGARRMLESRLPKGVSLFSEEALPMSCLPSLKAVLPSVFEDGTMLMDMIKGEKEHVYVQKHPSDECAYMCTSGSTSFYKLVAFRNENTLEWGRSFGAALGVTENSVYLNDRPLGWIGGYPSTYAATGCTRVLFNCMGPQPEDTISFTWEVMAREKCTNSYAVPLQLEKLTDLAKRKPHDDGHILDVIGCGSCPVLRRHMEAIGVVAKAVSTVYGSTEMGVVATSRVTDPEGFEDFESGSPTPGSEFKIVDPEGDLKTSLPPGEMGEILQKSTQASRRYVGDEKSTKETFLPGGWVRLGDLGYLTKKGLLSVVGRTKFAILRGPYVVYPEQLEIRIAQCPGVESVVITGVPDVELFEDICVLIVRKQGGQQVSELQVRTFCETELFAFGGNRELNPVPKYYLFVKCLPTMGNGKLDRGEAKRLAVKALGLEKRTEESDRK